MRHLAVLALAAFTVSLPAAASQPTASETPAATVDNPIHHAAGQSAETAVAVMTYETFEATIPHGDLPECPKPMAQEGRFCRVILHNESLQVFAFSEDGDQPLQAVLAYPLDQITFGD